VKVDEIFRDNDNKYVSSQNKGYYKIKPSDGSIETFSVDPKYDVIRFVRCGDEILMITTDKKILIYNPENDEIKEHDIVKLTNYHFTNDNGMEVNYISGNKVLIAIDSGLITGKITLKYYIYDYKTNRLTSLDKYKVDFIQTINSSLILYYGIKSQCIDPETLEILWTIEHKNGGSVQWLDWRGVLVVSDDAISCYAPP